MFAKESIIVRARFDGQVFVPLDPLDLPAGGLYRVTVLSADDNRPTLQKLAEGAKAIPASPDSPGDAAAQHDHYLYGTPKRENP